MALNADGDIRQGLVGQAAHMCSRRLMAKHQRVRLRAVNQPHRDPRIGRMKQRSLPLDQIPVIGVVCRRQPLGGPRNEVGHHRVDRNTATRNKNSRLASSAKITLRTALSEFLFDG